MLAAAPLAQRCGFPPPFMLVAALSFRSCSLAPIYCYAHMLTRHQGEKVPKEKSEKKVRRAARCCAQTIRQGTDNSPALSQEKKEKRARDDTHVPRVATPIVCLSRRD